MQTERLNLRPYRADDLDAFFGYVSDPAVVRFEPYAPMTRAQAEAELTRRMADPAFIAVALRGRDTLIGNVYLAAREQDGHELGYVFDRRYWGQGLASEACAALVNAAFAEGAHRIYAECDPENPASWRLLERLGFTREAHLRRNVWFWTDDAGRPLWKDTYIYGLLRTDR